MKDRGLRDSVCRRHCAFYSPGKKLMRCGTVEFLERNLSGRELRIAAAAAGGRADFSKDAEIEALVCCGCEFFEDGCDFRMGLPSPPCGGYRIVESMLRRAH